MDSLSVQEKKIKSIEMKKLALEMVYKAGSGHPGGSFSAADILTELVFGGHFRYTPREPLKSQDILVLDKGHATPIHYTLLHMMGYIEREQFDHYRQADMRSPAGVTEYLQGHPKLKPEWGIWASTGSLGTGFGQAAGIAATFRRQGKDRRVYCLISDGGMQEGIVWEVARNAHSWGLDNMICMLDHNGIQNDTFVSRQTDVYPIREKWETFGWKVLGHEAPLGDRAPSDLTGHDYGYLAEAFSSAGKMVSDGPVLIIANTVKGYGMKEMENNPEWHAKAPTPEQFRAFMEELDEQERELYEVPG